MNYIREELLRQQDLLAVLMSGKEQEPADDGEPWTDDGLTGEEAFYGFGTEARSLRPERRSSRQMDEMSVWAPDGIEGERLESTRSMTEDRNGLSRVWAAGMRRDSEELRIPAGDEIAVAFPQVGSGYETVFPLPAAMGRTLFVGEGTTAPLNVRSVSRCIQRDARRYDGGFSMY